PIRPALPRLFADVHGRAAADQAGRVAATETAEAVATASVSTVPAPGMPSATLADTAAGGRFASSSARRSEQTLHPQFRESEGKGGGLILINESSGCGQTLRTS